MSGLGGYRIGRLIRATPGVLLHEVGLESRRHWLKRLAPGAEAHADAFLAEAEALHEASHPGLFRVTDWGVDPQSGPYQLIEATDLEPFDVVLARLGVRTPDLPLGTALAIVLQVAKALASTHEDGLFHGALDPGSIWISRSGRIKVADFGIGAGPAPWGPPSGPPSGASDLHSLGALLGWLTPRAPHPQALDAATSAAELAKIVPSYLSEGADADQIVRRWLSQLSIPASPTETRGVSDVPEPTTLTHEAGDVAALDRIGEVVDRRYRILRWIGAGGMGTVYEAEQLNIGRKVALKTLRPSGEELEQDEIVTRFENEARSIAQLKHPNTLHLYDFGRVAESELYIVTELLTGETLEKQIERGPMDPTEVIRIGAEIADALAEAHSKGIVHRDVKPRNIFLDRVANRSVAKLLDFGLARLTGTPRGTKAGQAVGTPEYMSPEQAQGLEATPASDLYALGVTLYQCLTGRPPFEGGTASAVLAKQIEEKPKSLASLVPVVRAFPDLERLVMRLLAKRPSDRPSSAGEVRQRLLAASGPEAADPSESEATVSASTPEIRVGRYVLRSPLGRTPTSEVHRSFDPKAGREVAIKVLTDQAALTPVVGVRFRREAEGLKELRHPHIVEIYDFDTTAQGRPFLVMELIRGRTLRERLVVEGGFDQARTARIIGQVASALAAAHHRGFVHRDLKPGNIMLVDETASCVVKVIDFGLLRWRESDQRTALTRSDVLLGTPAYMAPEQIVDPSNAGPGADLYALGCITYATMTGHPPFSGSVSEVLRQHYTVDPTRLSDIGPLGPICRRLMARTPADRFQTALEVIEEIKKLGLDPGVDDAALERSLADSPDSVAPTMSRTPLTLASPPPRAGSDSMLPTPLPTVTPSGIKATSVNKTLVIALAVVSVLLLLTVGALLVERAPSTALVARPLPTTEPPPADPVPLVEERARAVVRVGEAAPTPKAPPAKTSAEPKKPLRDPSAELDAALAKLGKKLGASARELEALPRLSEVKKSFLDAKKSEDGAGADRALAELDTVGSDPALAAQLARARLDRLGRKLKEAAPQLDAEELGRYDRRFFDLGARLSRAKAEAEIHALGEEALALVEELDRVAK